MKLNKKAFTLIELIVVIAIIWFLGMVWVMTFMQWFSKSRDASRIAALQNMSMVLETYLANHTTFPLPDDYVEVKYSWETLTYQGKFGKNVVSELPSMKQAPKDPKDNTYYTYTVSADKKNYELLAMMEGQPEKVAYNPFVEEVYADDYTDRIPKTEWESVWVVLDENNNPIENLKKGSLELSWDTSTYKVVFGTNKEMTLSWKQLAILKWKAISGNFPVYWLVAEYNFDYDSGTTIYDTLWHYNWISSGGDVTLSDNSIIGKSLIVTGTDIVSYVSWITLPSEFTVSTWVYIKQKKSGINSFYSFVSYSGYEILEIVDDKDYWILHMDHGYWSESTDIAKFFSIYTGDDIHEDEGQWYNIVVTQNAGMLKVYRNWEKVYQNIAIKPEYLAQVRYLYFGQEIDHDSDWNTTLDSNQVLNWYLDQFRIYNRPLSESEIKVLYEEWKK